MRGQDLDGREVPEAQWVAAQAQPAPLLMLARLAVVTVCFGLAAQLRVGVPH